MWGPGLDGWRRLARPPQAPGQRDHQGLDVAEVRAVRSVADHHVGAGALPPAQGDQPVPLAPVDCGPHPADEHGCDRAGARSPVPGLEQGGRDALVTGPTIRLPGHHAKVKRDGYIGHRRGGPAPRARLGQRLQTCRFGRQMVKRRNEGQGLGPRE